MKKLLALIPGLLAVPFVVAAQDLGYLNDLGMSAVGFVNGVLVPLLVSVLILMFIYGMFKAFILGGSEDREEGKSYMVWAVVAFVVIFTLWGIVRLVGGLFGLNPDSNSIPNLPPVVPLPGGGSQQTL